MSDETKAPENVPYIVYESTQARNERHIKRIVTALIIAIIMIFASNFMWLAYINQFDFAEYDYTQDGRGVNIIGNMNGVDFDGSAAESENPNEKEP